MSLSFSPQDLKGDVYFKKDFVALHARHGHCGVFERDFVNAVSIVPIAHSERVDVETAWGYGGPLIASSNNVRDNLRFWAQRLREEVKPVAEFVRFHPFLNVGSFVDYFDMLTYNRHVILVDLQRSRDERWRSYSDSTKNCIRKASKTLKIQRLGPNDGALFQDLYEVGLERNAATENYFFEPDFYTRLLGSSWASAWLASDDNGAAAVACFLHGDAPICHYHLAGGNALSRRANAHYLLLESAFVEYAELGYRYMCLGGGRTTDATDPLLCFKKKFSQLSLPYYVGGNIYDLEAYGRLGGGISRFLCAGGLAGS